MVTHFIKATFYHDIYRSLSFNHYNARVAVSTRLKHNARYTVCGYGLLDVMTWLKWKCIKNSLSFAYVFHSCKFTPDHRVCIIKWNIYSATLWQLHFCRADYSMEICISNMMFLALVHKSAKCDNIFFFEKGEKKTETQHIYDTKMVHKENTTGHYCMNNNNNKCVHYIKCIVGKKDNVAKGVFG